MRPLAKHWRHDLIHTNHTVREATNKVLEMVDNGILNPRDVLIMALKWMSEDDVKEMCEANEIDLDMEDKEDDADND